jgi:DNA-binding TFAR19-related protein (PDSD5 family)
MDEELERIKRRRLAEMQRKMLLKQMKEAAPKPEPPKEPTKEDILNRYFRGRAWEVFNAAKTQYPQVISQIETALIDAINQGKIKQTIDGAMLSQFFRQIGIPVRLNTKIRVSDHGELKTLEQVMKEKE